MTINNVYSHYLAIISLAYKKKKLHVSVPYSSVGFLLLIQLQKCGVVQFFYVKPALIKKNVNNKNIKRNIIVFLKYINGLPTFTYFRNYWNLRKKINLKFSGSFSILSCGLNSVLLVKTKYGILSGDECSRIRIGGLLVCAIYL